MAENRVPRRGHRFKNIADETYFLLTAKEPVFSDQRGWNWLFECKCGNRKVLPASQVKNGKVKSCGCLEMTEAKRERSRNQGKYRSGHGHARGYRHSPEYGSWHCMIQRCCNSGHKAYRHYGGRGITVCDRWRKSFPDFYRDMGPRPGVGYSIERRHNDVGYEPGNCYWATASQQARNKRPRSAVTCYGVTMSIVAWSDRTGIPYPMLYYRITHGWSPERALTEPGR